MVKKVVSFIIILLAYSIIGVFFLYARSMSDLSSRLYEINSAFALDRAGDIYFITTDDSSAKKLTVVDSTGKRLLEKELSTENFGESFYVDSIYVEHDRNIYLTVYDYDYERGIITNASVHSFHEDGSYASRIFTEKVSLQLNAYSHIISAFTEDDSNIYFSILANGAANIYSAPKNGSEPAAKVGEIPVLSDVYGFVTMSSKSIAVGNAEGITIYNAGGGSYNVGSFSGAVFDRFWNGIDSFYAMDSASGNIYLISENNSPVNVVSGSRSINLENGLSVADMDDIAVGITGNIMGTVRGNPIRIFAGSFSLMSEVSVSNTNLANFINRILIYVAVAAVVILLTVLTWDFFCSVLKMRLSIMLRQSLLIVLAIAVMMFSMMYLLLVPQLSEIISNDVKHEIEVSANAFEAEILGALGEDGATDYMTYENLLNNFGKVQSAPDPENAVRFQTTKKPLGTLIESRNNRLSVIASSELYPSGYPANMLVYSCNLKAELKTSENGLICRDVLTPHGERVFYVRPIELPDTENKTYLFVEMESNLVNDSVMGVITKLLLFLISSGIALAAIFMLIESITARAVRRLKRSVDKIALGEYNTPVEVKTGDEVEELSVSVGALAKHIIEKTTSLEKLNNSYYRFVPQSFLANLGENQIERVGKSLYAEKHMAVLFLRFSFSQPLSGMEAQEIFSNINSVYEHIVPIINSNGGTAYNFLFNGLSAIFPDSTDNALQAAIRIREEIGAYNEIQRSKNIRTADVRMVISEGEVLLGFIGDDRRMEPSAVSAAINESEEIEKILNGSGLYIVCTERAFSSLPKDKYRSRSIGSFVTAEGERELYDMFDSDPYTMIKLKEQFMERFELGVSLFKKQEFTKARTVFMDIVKYAADDGVSRNYMYICERNLTAEKKQLTYIVYTDQERE